MKKRQESREQAFIIVFEKQFNPDCTVDELCETAKEAGLFEYDGFVSSLAGRTFESLDEIDSTIGRYLASGWKISRLSKVVLAILRLAVCEILYFDSVPYAVSINEAVELAKKYAADQDPAFVNAVLGSAVKNLNKDGEKSVAEAVKQDFGSVVETESDSQCEENENAEAPAVIG